MKTRQYVSRPGQYFSTGGVKAVNMRPETGADGSLEFCQCPHPQMHGVGARYPLAAIGDKTILCSDRTLSVEGNGDGSEHTMPSAPLFALPTSGGAIAMTSAGAFSLGIDGTRPTAESMSRRYPPVAVEGVEAGVVTGDVSERRLSHIYNGGSLSTADAKAVIGDLEQAYLAAVAEGTAGGMMLQPAVARYRLRAADGKVLFVSPPVLVCHPDGAQCNGAVGLYSPDRCNINAYSLSLKGWKLRLHIPADSVGEVAALDVYITPQMHPYRSGQPYSAVLSRGDGSTAPFARITLPGRQNGISSTRPQSSELSLRRILAHIDDLEQCVATVTSPFSGTTRTIDVSLPSDIDADADGRKIDSVCRRAVSRAEYTDVLLSPPHTFTAATGAAGSGMVAWGNITVQRYEGFGARAFACGCGSGAWNAVTRVRFADGSVALRSETCGSGAPSAFGPILSYPSPDAVEMTIVAYYGGVNHRMDVPLTPDPSRRFAVYVSPAMKPFALPAASAAQLMEGDMLPVAMPSTVVFADASDALTVRSYAVLDGTPVSLAHIGGVQQAWEVGRTRFLAATRRAIICCTVPHPDSGGKVGLRSLLNCADSTPSLCRGEPGEVFAAIGNAVYVLTSGRTEAIKKNMASTALGYNAARGELWCLTAAGTVRVLCRRHNWAAYDITGLRYRTFSDTQSGFAAVGDTFYTSPCADGGPADTDIQLHLPAFDNSDGAVPHSVTIRCTAASFAGDIELRPSESRYSRRPPFLRLALSGSVTAPLTVPLHLRGTAGLDIRIEGRSRSFRFSSTVINY